RTLSVPRSRLPTVALSTTGPAALTAVISPWEAPWTMNCRLPPSATPDSAITRQSAVVAARLAAASGAPSRAGSLLGSPNSSPPFANLSVSYSTFTGNRAMGGSSGGVGTGGGIDMFGTGIIGQSTFTGNQAIGGEGGVITDRDPFIGIGLGGGISTEGPDTTGAYSIDQCTFTNNESHGGNGGSGGS